MPRAGGVAEEVEAEVEVVWLVLGRLWHSGGSRRREGERGGRRHDNPSIPSEPSTRQFSRLSGGASVKLDVTLYFSFHIQNQPTR